MFQKLLTEMAINLVKDKATVIASTVAKEGIALATQIHEDGISTTAKNALEVSRKYVKSVTDKNVTVEKDKVYTIKDGYQFLMVDDADLPVESICGIPFVILQNDDIDISFDLLPTILPKGYTLLIVDSNKILIIEYKLIKNDTIPFPIKKL